MLLLGQSDAFPGEKQCFAPRKALLGQKIRIFGASEKSVLKVGFSSVMFDSWSNAYYHSKYRMSRIFSPFSFQHIHVTFFFYIFAKGQVNQRQYNLNSYGFIAKIALI